MTLYTPYWWEEAPRPELPQSDVIQSCDAVVIGAGYAGLSAAMELARAGRSVQVFDKDRAGEGASSRNGGIGSGNLRISFSRLIQTHGMERAKAMYGEGVAARDDLTRFIEEENINCHYAPVGRFTGATRAEHYEGLAHNSDLLRKHFGLDTFAVPKSELQTEIGTEVYHGGVIRNDIGGVHPALLHQGLLERALGAGVTVHAHTAVHGIRGEAGNFDVSTARGTVKSKDVIVCTNGYTGAGTPWLRRRVVPVPSLMIATEPLSADLMDKLVPKRRMLGDTNHVHHYFRPSPDGTRILFGGRTNGALTVDGPVDHRQLQQKMVRIFPELENVGLSHIWWGYVAMNRDHLPQFVIKDGIYYPTGFCGSGVVWARWFGRKAALQILGDSAGKCAFEGQPFKSIPFYNGNSLLPSAAILWYKMRDTFKI
jgi:glycine/D-amino acid oxidase-like deaminating enzyme